MAFDYVVIDERDKPLENIRLDLNRIILPRVSNTAATALLRRPPMVSKVSPSRYGKASLIFTPWAIWLYSSSAFIKMEAPDVRHANLQIVMERNDITGQAPQRAERHGGPPRPRRR